MDPEYHSLYLYLAKAYEREEEIEKSYRGNIRKEFVMMNLTRIYVFFWWENSP